VCAEIQSCFVGWSYAILDYGFSILDYGSGAGVCAEILVGWDGAHWLPAHRLVRVSGGSRCSALRHGKSKALI
jgi:hypothetical protein